MNLKHITFTGIDWRTSLNALLEIQRQNPIVEFGVLTSYHWNENGNRYLCPDIIRGLRGRGLNLSLHLCGSAAHDAAIGEWEKIDNFLLGSLDIFKRVQLNISSRKDNPEYCKIPLVIGQELIVQQHDVDDMPIYEATVKKWSERPFSHRDTISVLLDASGGRGIDTQLKVLPSSGKVGYAGGFNPDNVGDKLAFLLQNVRTGEFWIDMESGVRTDDWFDTNKVIRVLDICKEVISESTMNNPETLGGRDV